jgi:hypothetical protein
MGYFELFFYKLFLYRSSGSWRMKTAGTKDKISGFNALLFCAFHAGDII